MTIKEFADGLSGREYREEITPGEEKLAKELGFVVVFGYSDDNVEFCGAINDEVGCYEGRTILLDADGIFETECNPDECSLLRRHLNQCKTIDAIWDTEGYSWTYQTDIPHETFDIFEDGEKYCRGIVFDLKEVFK